MNLSRYTQPQAIQNSPVLRTFVDGDHSFDLNTIIFSRI